MKKIQLSLKEAYDSLKTTRNQIKEAYEDMLIRLAIAAEYKDPGIGGHIRRVSDYSTAIAKSFGLPDKEILILRYASMMHDIGKIGISNTILDKNSSLTPEEHKEIEQHTIIGASIFEGSDFPMVKACAEIALNHHEKYDGTGYPKGLKGEAIPLYARFVSLADYFDALISERSYKKAWSFDDVIRDIEHKANTFFDPLVVIAFLKIRDKIKTILEANAAIEDFTKSKL